MKLFFILLSLITLPLVLTNIDSSIREGRFVNLKNMKAKWKHQNLIPGIQGDNYLETNKYGLKGDEFGDERYRILVIGNSLVEGALIDTKEIWTNKLQENLQKSGFDAKVFNAGKSGFISAQRFPDVYNAYKKYGFDLVILYPLARYNSHYKNTEGFAEFYVPDYKNDQFGIKNNSVVQILRNRKWEFASYIKKRFDVRLFKNAIVDPNHVKAIFERSKKRKTLPFHKITNDYYKDYGNEYINGLKYLSDFFKKEKVPVISFDRLHKASLIKGEEDAGLWWGNNLPGKNGELERIPLTDYKKILSLEHKINQDFSRKNFHIIKQEELDVKRDWLYDQEHFSEKGSSELARALTPFIKKKLPKSP